MKLLQTPRLKQQKTKILFNFNTVDSLVLFFNFALGFILGFLIYPPLAIYFKVLIAFLVITFASVDLIYLSNHNARIYIVLIRMFIYLLTPKKYKEKKAKTEYLLPYKALINNIFVEMQPRNNQRYYLGFIKFSGFDLSKYDKDDRIRVFNNLIDLLNSLDIHFSFVKTRNKANYGVNIDSIEQASLKAEFLNYKKHIINDFIEAEENNFIENYYFIVYENKIKELEFKLTDTLQKLEENNFNSSVVKGNEIVYLLNKINNVSPDYNKIDLAFFGQMEPQKEDEVEEIKTIKKVNKLSDFIKRIFSKKITAPKMNVKEYESYIDNLSELINIESAVFKKDHVVLNDVAYVAYHTISQMPLQLSEMWARVIFEEDNTIVWHFDPISNSDITNLLDRSQSKMITNINTTKSNFKNKKSALDIEATEHLSYKLLIDNEALFNSQMVIVTEADNYANLKLKLRSLNNNSLRNKIKLNMLLFRQFEGLAQSQLLKSWWLKEHIEMLASNIAGGFPFINDEFNDGDILLTANSLTTNNAFILDQFTKDIKRRNHNMLIFGNSGSGKTVFTKKILLKNLALNNDCIIIDPENEYTELVNRLGYGTIIDFGTGMNTSINPLQITNSFIDDNMEQAEMTNTIIINKHINFLEYFFKLAIKDLDNYELILLSNAITKLYEKLKFYEETRDITKLKVNEYPLITDLISLMRKESYKNEFDAQSKAYATKRLADKIAFLFTERGKYATYYNDYTNITIDSKLTIFNTQRLIEAGQNESSVSLALFVMLQFIQNAIYYNKINKTTKTVLCIDEAHIYLNKATSSVFDFIFTMTKRIRKYNGSLMLTTQNAQDFNITSSSGLNAQSITANCQYSAFFSLKQNDIEIIDDMYKAIGGLNQTEKRFLLNAKAGQCLLTVSSNERNLLQVHYNNYEKELFWK